MAKVPNLRFPGFEGEKYDSYKKHFFKDLFLFSTGKNIKQDEASPEFEIPCVRYGELYYMYGEVIKEIVNRTCLDKSELLLSEGNEILLPSAGEDPLDIGSASALTIENVAIGRTINILKPINANLYSHIYVSYYINQKLRKKISTLSKGSSISNVYNSDLKTLEITLPDLTEQWKIASFLLLIDDRIQTQSKIIKDLELLKKNIARGIFSNKFRFTDENGKQFVNKRRKTLDELCEIVMGQSPNSNSYNADKNGLPLIQGNADIIDRVTEPRNWTTDPTKKCSIGNLILTVRAPVGSVSKSLHNACIGRGVCAISEKSGNSLSFIYQFLLNYEDQWGSIEQGSTFTAISGKDIKKLVIDTPSLKEQVYIAKFLSLLDEIIDVDKKKLTLYKTEKQYLLSKLFI